MPSKAKKVSKKSNLDTVNIEVDPKNSLISNMKSADEIMDLKDNEILGELEVEKPKVS